MIFQILKSFESYKSLYAYDLNISETRLALDKGVKSIEAWEKSYENHQITRSILEECPIISNDAVGSVVVDVLRAGDLSEAPTPIVELDKKAQTDQGIFLYGYQPSNREDGLAGRWIVYKSKGTISISVPVLDSDWVKKPAEFYAKTIAYGDRKNIFYLLKAAKVRITQKLHKLSDLQTRLRSSLLPNSSLTSKIYIYNNGMRATTTRPYFGVRILHPSFKDRLSVLAADRTNMMPEEDESPFQLTSRGFTISGSKKKEGKDVVAVPYLPSGTASEYVQLAPGESKAVPSTSIVRLGLDAENLVKVLQTSLLEFQVLAITASGKEISSEKASFGDKIGQEQTEEIKKIMENNTKLTGG